MEQAKLDNQSETMTASGKIIKVDQKSFGGKDPLNTIHLNNNREAFTIFGKFDFKEGDEISFDYIIKNGKYYNITTFHDIKVLHTEADIEEVEKIIKRLDVTSERPLAMDLAFKYGILMNYDIHEIDALYQRILEVLSDGNNLTKLYGGIKNVDEKA